MAKVYIFFATGCEEVEALAVVDLLRRAKIETVMVSVTGEKIVTSSHGVSIVTDALFEEIDDSADMIVLPGGLPGTHNLAAHAGLTQMIHRFAAAGNSLAAIRAGPTV